MLSLVKIYFLFNLHYILSTCDPGKGEDLSVRILDKKLIEQKRQDTRDMCKLFNSDSVQASLATESPYANKYDKRKKELKLKEKKEKLKKNKASRIKRSVNSVNPALGLEDENRVETIVDKIYDDLLEKGQKFSYRRKGVRPDVTTRAVPKGNILAANKPGRRFPFAPFLLEGPGPTTNRAVPTKTDMDMKPVRFPNAIVPYFIDSKTYDSQLSETIMKAFDYIEKATCIRLQRLRERPTDMQSLQNVYWIYITNPTGIRQCVHSNEMASIKGVQMIVFGYDCMTLGDISHEIMHVLGFTHEHSRPDRDQYITILWDNIKPGYKKFFEMRSPILDGLPYDYASVLHYPPRAFSKNGQVTILTETGIKIGQREGLSEMDVEKIGIVYTNECIKRNREYLLKTCPSVVKPQQPKEKISQQEIEDYFDDRLWPYGVVNYKFKNPTEFSAEEKENINAVIRHIEKETCIEFRDLTQLKDDVPDKDDTSSEYHFDTREDGLVVLGSDEHTKAILPDTSSDEQRLANEIVDPLKKAVRKRVDGKDKSVEGKDKSVVGKDKSVVGKNKSIHGKDKSVVKVANTNIKGKNDTNVVVKGNNTNIDNKIKTANVTNNQFVRRKRAAPPPTATRRHVNHILMLSKSPQPGCRCPQPGKPEVLYELTINTDCFNSVNDLLHIFVHILGLDHQHNMHDRDSYLHIIWDQLTEDVKTEMSRKLPPSASVGFPYDYQSVMHYPWLQIKNGKTNIMYPIWNDGWAMGHWQGLSSTDVQKLNLLYFKRCMERNQEQGPVEETKGAVTDNLVLSTSVEENTSGSLSQYTTLVLR